jgi:hypothetical protein
VKKRNGLQNTIAEKYTSNLDIDKQDNSIEENIMNEAVVSNFEASSANPIAAPILLQRGAPIKNRLLKSAMSEALGTTDNRATRSNGTYLSCKGRSD